MVNYVKKAISDVITGPITWGFLYKVDHVYFLSYNSNKLYLYLMVFTGYTNFGYIFVKFF